MIGVYRAEYNELLTEVSRREKEKYYKYAKELFKMGVDYFAVKATVPQLSDEELIKAAKEAERDI